MISRSCPSARSKATWIAAQGSRPLPSLPDRCVRASAAGFSRLPLRPMNSARSQVTVPVAHRPRRRRRPGRETRCCRGCARERAAVGIDFGDHVHGRSRPQVAQHPLHVAGGGEPARPARGVAHLEHGELDRRILGHIDPQLGVDAVLGVLEHAVAEAVPGDVGRRAAPGQRRRRPEMAAFLVAQVEGLAARVGDRVVVPGREAELVGVLAPGVGLAALRDDGAEVRIGQHVDPGRRRESVRAWW